jgi:UDP-glucose 4-epimerase
MRVLATGASGFVGRYVVPAIAARGHIVRALSRRPVEDFESVEANLLQPSTLPAALRDSDAVVHLAISVTPAREILRDETIEGTKNLCDAMVAAGVSRLIHCSSRAVYDWKLAKRTPDESAPLDANPQLRDEYTQAKIAQEHLIQDYAAKHNWRVTILRPGFIWGPGREQLAGWGHSFGRLHVVVDGRRRLPMTYVENCAECFALAVDERQAEGQAFNIVDDDLPTAREYAELQLRQAGQGGPLVGVPYWPGLALAQVATGVNRAFFGGRLNLPTLLAPASYRARFSPIHLSNRKAKDLLDWRPRCGFQEAWERACNSTTPAERSGVGEEQPGGRPREVTHGS